MCFSIKNQFDIDRMHHFTLFLHIRLSFFYCVTSLLYNCSSYYLIVQFNCSISYNLFSYICEIAFLALLSTKIAFRYVFLLT